LPPGRPHLRDRRRAGNRSPRPPQVPLRGAFTVKVNAASPGFLPAGRLVQRIRDDILSSRTVERLERELEEELDTVSRLELGNEDDARRDALERAVRRVWGATL